MLLVTTTYTLNASADYKSDLTIEKELTASHKLELDNFYQWFNVRANIFINRFQATAQITNFYRFPIFCRVSAIGYNRYIGRNVFSNMQGWIYPGNTMYVYVNGQFTNANANSQCRF